MQPLSFSDIFKSSFLENVTSVSLTDMVIVLILSLALGLFIYFVYQKTYQGVMYSSSFGVTLVALTMITSLLILAVTSNIVLSLGMVGALSIVRFRTAIKEPLDIAFLFWAIAVGIVLAAGFLPLAVFGSILVGLVLIVLVKHRPRTTPFIVVVSCATEAAEQTVTSILGESCGKVALKGKTVRPLGLELNYEVRLREADDTSFVGRIAAIEGVRDVALVSYNGDYVS